MNEENKIKPRKIRQLKKSGYLDKIIPSIPKNEEILDIQLDIFMFPKIMGYFLIPIIICGSLVVGTFFNNYSLWNLWTFLTLIIGIICYIYYIFFFKKGYEIKILVFTDKLMYLFDNKKERNKSVKYSDSKYINFVGSEIHSKKKNFYSNLGLNFRMKSNITSLKFMYYLLNYHCNPKIQIKNRLNNQNVHNAEQELQKILNKTLFKISNERYNDIYEKKRSLIVRFAIYEILTFVIMILLLLFVDIQIDPITGGYLNIMFDAFILLIGILCLIGFSGTFIDFKNSYNKMNFRPDSMFEVCSDGIKAATNSGDVWMPFEENLIIGEYNTIEKIFSLFSPKIYDGLEIKRFNEKHRLYQIGPVEDHEYFYDIVMFHYLKWLEKNNKILKKEQILQSLILSDPNKGDIAEKITLKEDIVVPNISDMSSFYIGSEKATFKYPKDSYTYYIPVDEKIYYIHQKKTIPTFVRVRLYLSLGFTIMFGLLVLLFFVYFQIEFPDTPEIYVLLIFAYFPISFTGRHLLRSIKIIKDFKDREVIFTESKIIFKREDWLYPLTYDAIKHVYKISENRKKRYYKYLRIYTKKQPNATTLYGISHDNPILTILNSKCEVK